MYKTKITQYQFKFEGSSQLWRQPHEITRPRIVYADFECINQPQPKVVFKQFPIAVGTYEISSFGSLYYSYLGTDCVNWFVYEMVTPEKMQIAAQEGGKIEEADSSRFCEPSFDCL